MSKLPSVLIIENHEDTAGFLRLYLEQRGHEVFWAGDLASARTMLLQYSPGVVICDIGLPDGSGWELLEGLPPERRPYAIAMSGFGSSVDREKSLRAGFRYHLVKPFLPDDLDALLEAVISSGDASC